MKLVGCVLIVLGCACCGAFSAFTFQAEIKMLRSLHAALQHMASELNYRLLPLPALLLEGASVTNGKVSGILTALSAELDRQSSPDVKSCMAAVIQDYADMPNSVLEYLKEISYSLGKFDLKGQLQGLAYISERISEKVCDLETDKASKVQLAKTVGMCAGIGLAIVLL